MACNANSIDSACGRELPKNRLKLVDSPGLIG